MQQHHRKIITKTFQTGIWLKSFAGFAEIIAGIILAVVGKSFVFFIQQEILAKFSGFFIDFLMRASNDFLGELHFFTIIYLFFHGFVNVFMAINLLKGKLWAYPWAIWMFSVFLIYQIYKYVQTHPTWLLLLTIFDILVVIIIFIEYKNKTNEASQ